MLVRVNDVENAFNDEEVETNDVSTILENVDVWNARCRERKG